MKILTIAPSAPCIDYLQNSVYLGLKGIFGTDVECNVPLEYYYKSYKENGPPLWGKGFSYTNILDDNLECVAENILEKVKDKYYDLIVYLFVSRANDGLEEILNITQGKNVFLINGEDTDYDLYYHDPRVVYFKRELVEKKHSNVFPIGYAIHESKLCKDKVVKTKEISDSIPSFDDMTTVSSSKYIFDKEEDYYRDYQVSKYGLTRKKAGWDTMRHYEILANKCIPLFTDIDDCPELTLTRMPKKLFSEIKNAYPNISDSQYEKYRDELFEYTKENLTTEKLAKYILEFYE